MVSGTTLKSDGQRFHRMKTKLRRGGNRKGQAAFTLPEVLVAVMIVGIVFVSLYAGITRGMALIDSSRDNLRSTQVMLDTMEVMRLYNWEQINSNGFLPTNFVVDLETGGIVNMSSTTKESETTETTKTTESGDTQESSEANRAYATITVATPTMDQAYKTNIREITVTLTWTNNTGLVSSREMRTFVTRDGLQNYIYNH